MSIHDIGESEEDDDEREEDRGDDGVDETEEEVELNLRLSSVETEAPRIHRLFSVLFGFHQKKVLEVIDDQRF